MFKYKLAMSTWDHRESDAIQRVLSSGDFKMGWEVENFERRVAEYLGSKHCVMVNSGSSANLLMIQALLLWEHGISVGDEVIVPAVSWSTTYAPLQQLGLKLRFVDIDIETLNYDLHKLSVAISSETRVIFAVNLLGNPNDFDSIRGMIGSKDILLLEDNCESLGSTFNGKYSGTFGVMGSLSFFYSHHISTMEGGAVLTDSKDLCHILMSIREHGWTRSIPADCKYLPATTTEFDRKFQFIFPGFNVRPLEISGAVGSEQMAKLPQFLEARRANARYFLDRMSLIQEFSPQREIGASSWFGFSVLITNGEIKREAVIERLNARGIESRPIVTGNFLRSPAMKFFNYEAEDTPSADNIHENGFFVGNHHLQAFEYIDEVCAVLESFNV